MCLFVVPVLALIPPPWKGEQELRQTQRVVVLLASLVVPSVSLLRDAVPEG